MLRSNDGQVLLRQLRELHAFGDVGVQVRLGVCPAQQGLEGAQSGVRGTGGDVGEAGRGVRADHGGRDVFDLSEALLAREALEDGEGVAVRREGVSAVSAAFAVEQEFLRDDVEGGEHGTPFEVELGLWGHA
ncbi:hypothetical protein DES52_10975 [Deinococcus yavapaiensis KR-236]|uniref:Uncharacterized protein n=1 Tax=Deinococcus yavapaiensis KR-236 TaxID=694435 RepID=A0A318S8D8_9DEIO|nr:hypothetical protein [Deinococcus yavapaiensis]PYE53303.1 hypothetical protein DES52_10975 [Deinococcus yavapaiensis KR-236]